MDYKDGVEKLFLIVKETWQKVDSGFYPEIDEGLKLLAIQNKISAGRHEEGFWELIRFLIKDLLAMSEEDFSDEKENLEKILKDLTDGTTVQQGLKKIKLESQIGDKTIEIIESLQKDLMA